MSTQNYNPPLVVDLTAYLAAKGVDVPNAKIKIYSSYHVGRSNLEPGAYYMMLGENGWATKNHMAYALMLANYAPPSQDLGRISAAQWYYNQCNFAMRERLKQHD